MDEEEKSSEDVVKNESNLDSKFVTPPDNKIIFKKPEIVTNKLAPTKQKNAEKIITEDTADVQTKNDLSAASYEAPRWSSIPCSSTRDYELEVLKDGKIVETINLMTKSHWIIGRFTNSDIIMQHPTISRYHCVLQFKKEEDKDNETGFYVYDLESTHGTFLNKMRIRPRSYMRVKVGHMIKLGCSSRNLILNGPDEDTENETDLTYSEIKQKHIANIEKIEGAKAALEKNEKDGIDWGMGEDADEITDLSVNPFAQTTNEQLYLDDPKKTLRGFFEREGLNLEYICTEQGFGQFLCKVELPVDDECGRPIFAEVLHKGKKKDSVIQCALEACKILDMHGLLRQAEHESRKRKTKNWAENDYYDSDDDTFLDQTGDIEKKREKRMQANQPKVETYETLMQKEKKLSEQIKDKENQLESIQKYFTDEKNKPENDEIKEDSLDAYMENLKDSKPDKTKINKLKNELVKLKQEYSQVVKLANIVKPTELPTLKIPETTNKEKIISNNSKVLPIFGKRKKIKVQIPTKVVEENVNDPESEEEN